MTKFYKFSYNNLYIDVSETQRYLQEYKKKDITNIKLVLNEEKQVELYDSNNNLISSSTAKEFSLVGVSYIKLVGEGELGHKSNHGLMITY